MARLFLSACSAKIKLPRTEASSLLCRRWPPAELISVIKWQSGRHVATAFNSCRLQCQGRARSEALFTLTAAVARAESRRETWIKALKCQKLFALSRRRLKAPHCELAWDAPLVIIKKDCRGNVAARKMASSAAADALSRSLGKRFLFQLFFRSPGAPLSRPAQMFSLFHCLVINETPSGFEDGGIYLASCVSVRLSAN